jgi:hypothetical protein
MRLWFTKQRAKVLAPADAGAEKLLAKMQLGECALFEVQRPRSVQWNKLYWSLCRTIGHNQDPTRDEDSIDTELRVRSGHFEVYLFDGMEVRVPRRIAFDRMSADQWEEYFKKVEMVVRERFGDEFIDVRGFGT